MSRVLSILVADDEEELRAGLRWQLEGFGHKVDEAVDGQDCWEKLQAKDYDVLFLDVRMPRASGLDVLKLIKEYRSSVSVFVVTAQGSVKDAVRAMRDGAYDYIEKPINKETVADVISKVLEARSLMDQIDSALIRHVEGEEGNETLMTGEFDYIESLRGMVEKSAANDLPALFCGELGTGKERVARAVHLFSGRKKFPFISVNGYEESSALERKLWGYEKGAFAGAESRQLGLLQSSSGGTLFVNCFERLTMPLQIKLVDLLKHSELRPLGSDRVVKVDFRVFVASPFTLSALQKSSMLSRELLSFYESQIIRLAPLRERGEDIRAFLLTALRAYSVRHVKSFRGFEPSLLDRLVHYRWPGNIRELEGAVEHAVLVGQNEYIVSEDLPEAIQESLVDLQEGWELEKAAAGVESTEDKRLNFSQNYQEDKGRFEKEFIIQALKKNGGKINQTCESVSIPKNTLLRKIKKYNIKAKDYE